MRWRTVPSRRAAARMTAGRRSRLRRRSSTHPLCSLLALVLVRVLVRVLVLVLVLVLVQLALLVAPAALPAHSSHPAAAFARRGKSWFGGGGGEPAPEPEPQPQDEEEGDAMDRESKPMVFM